MIAIKLENISKIYKIYSKPSDRLKEIIFRKNLHRDFVALKNINLTINHGDIIGIIGENGAGKSTLLKIISKIIKPTTGKLKIFGKLSALLELGAGFHPDFTGRQNIYINGALLGLKKEEIKKREKEIIEFSELGEFIDQPVKTYSSGMYVRLAFSIATAIDPDILVVDEALSVGDQHFQKKSIDRMMKFCKEGRTILFCSHNFYHLQELCSKGIWLHKGEVKYEGNIKDAIQKYQSYLAEKEKLEEKKEEIHEKLIFIKELWQENSNGEKVEVFSIKEDIKLNLKIGSLSRKLLKGHIGLGIIRYDEILAFGVSTHFDGLKDIELIDDKVVSLELKNINLLPGEYRVYGVIFDETGMHPYDLAKSKPFKIEYNTKAYGMCFLNYKWKIE